MGTDRNRKDDPVEGSREVVDDELKRRTGKAETGKQEQDEKKKPDHHPTQEELGPKGVP